LEAHYLSLGIATFICTLAPQRVILGGGVMKQAHLFPLIRNRVRALLNGYLPLLDSDAALARLIVPPALADRAGVFGAIALAQQM
jgi:fructokinase